MDIYVTKAKLKINPYNISEEDADNTYLETLQEITKGMIDRICHQDFSQEGTAEAYVEKKISGTGQDTIFMPKKLITLEKIRIYSSATGYIDYLPTNFTVKEKFISWNYYSYDGDNPRLYPEDFAIGSYNIGVFGIWGWSAYPEAIKYLQGRMIQKIIEEGGFANKMENEKAGDYTFKLLMDKRGLILGDFELDAIVRQYRDKIRYAAV